MNNNVKFYINKIGSPKIFVYLIIWLMILTFFGTIAQKDSGLYLVQLDYFSSWVKWFAFIPTPSAKLTMLFMTANLSCYFFKPNIWNVKKIGITITHSGVMLLLFGSGLTSLFSLEGNMIINEGESSNYFENFYLKEFAIINRTNSEFDDYVIFDESSLFKNNILNHQSLPFEIEIIDYYINCTIVQRQVPDESFKGMAKNFYLDSIKSEKEYEQNRPGIIYRLKGLNDNSDDGVYIQFMNQAVDQDFTISENFFKIQLRPNRTYVPFQIELVDFKKNMHPGTEIASSFSSSVNLIEDGISRKVLIEMNVPLRHYDYTFYQASYIEQNGIETSVLATVKNYGRLFPYISSVIMCIGILVHMLVMMINRFNFKKS